MARTMTARRQDLAGMRRRQIEQQRQIDQLTRVVGALLQGMAAEEAPEAAPAAGKREGQRHRSMLRVAELRIDHPDWTWPQVAQAAGFKSDRYARQLWAEYLAE